MHFMNGKIPVVEGGMKGGLNTSPFSYWNPKPRGPVINDISDDIPHVVTQHQPPPLYEATRSSQSSSSHPVNEDICCSFLRRQRTAGKNFPPCCPFFKHDINSDIPENLQPLVRRAFFIWMALTACLVYQFFCACCALGYHLDSKVVSWFLSVLFLTLGSPLAFTLWYLRLYNGAAYDAAIAYFWFFIFFGVHLAWVIYSIIAVPFKYQRWCFTSYPTAIRAFADAPVWLGVIYIIGACLWTLVLLVSLWTLKEVYEVFRARTKKSSSSHGHA